jgi:hypothetical protein
MNANRDEPPVSAGQVDPGGPLPNRLSRGTFVGCLGILCVLALPALLFLPVEDWRLPVWLVRMVPLLGLSIVAVGVWLLGRVPASASRRVDPLHPLTSAGHPPVVERPATGANRLGLAIAVCLSLVCLGGYVTVSAGSPHGVGVLVGTLIATAGGFALLVYGLLAATRRLDAPALRWVRAPIEGGVVFQALPAVLIGFVTLVWALFVAAGEGYLWAPAGVGLLILSWAVSGSILQRLPRSGRRWRD